MTENLNIAIVTCSYHRNGISGLGFYAVIFDATIDGFRRRILASVFDERGACAVYALDELAKENITFAQGNSWRGDEFEAGLRPLIADFGNKSFGIPEGNQS